MLSASLRNGSVSAWSLQHRIAEKSSRVRAARSHESPPTQIPAVKVGAEILSAPRFRFPPPQRLNKGAHGHADCS